jgi:hypothetical protein
MVDRNIREYNTQLMDMAKCFESRVMLVQTQHMNELAVQTRVFDFANATGCVSRVNLNVRSLTDGESPNFI